MLGWVGLEAKCNEKEREIFAFLKPGFALMYIKSILECISIQVVRKEELKIMWSSWNDHSDFDINPGCQDVKEISRVF